MKATLVLILFLSLSAHAKSRNRIDFDEQLVKGKSNQPDVFTIMQKNGIKYDKLIKLRENFLPEMKKGISSVNRK